MEVVHGGASVDSGLGCCGVGKERGEMCVEGKWVQYVNHCGTH